MLFPKPIAALIALALMALPCAAQTNIGNATWTAQGASTTTRTSAIRAGEITNVKDYGATGDGTTDDLAAIQAAVDRRNVNAVTTAATSTSSAVLTFAGGVPAAVVAEPFGAWLIIDVTHGTAIIAGESISSVTSTTVTMGHNAQGPGVSSGDTIQFYYMKKGTIFFPPGKYKIGGPIVLNCDGPTSFIFEGEGIASTITGTFNDFLIDCPLGANGPEASARVVEKLSLSNFGASGGAIRMSSSIGGGVYNNIISANQGVWVENSQSVAIQANSLTVDTSVQSGSNGIYIGGNGTIDANDITTLETGVRAIGVGVGITNNRFEVNIVGVRLGVDSTGANAALSGFTITGGSFESNGTAIYFQGGSGQCIIGGFLIQGFNSAIPGHPQYGIRIPSDNGQFCTFEGINVGGQYDIAAIDVEHTTNRNGLVFNGVHATNSGSGVPWILPTTAHTATFINCDILPTYLFANLPVSGNLRQGDSYFITDANQATIGGAVTSGGAPNTAGYVTYNGSGWTLMSK